MLLQKIIQTNPINLHLNYPHLACRCLMIGNLSMGLPGARIGGLQHKLDSMVKRETTIYTGLDR